MAWIGPSPTIVTDYVFQDMIEAGFTINFSTSFVNTTPTIEENLKMLDIAEKSGLKILIEDYRINPVTFSDSTSYACLDSVISDYKNHMDIPVILTPYSGYVDPLGVLI